MELTQRLECTQDLYQSNNEKITPDQIGFLGICGKKYAVQKGPNKIGRDPDSCNVVLDLNSISRHHAVINVLNKHEFMLMDLDSANKTKLNGKTLQPYIPSALKNGDMVQFGQVFGVFRLIEEESDLPMTQAIDIPETPVQNRFVSKINNQCTMIPESPDVSISDKDDSFIGVSQQKTNSVFKSPKDTFLKTCGKTIAIEPLGTNKIDNVYWTSSKKSDSFTSQCNISNNVKSSGIPDNIHELETQLPYINKDDSNDSIYDAITQLDHNRPLPIHEMETQLPMDLPEVTRIDEQQNIQLDIILTDNKENEDILNPDIQTTKVSGKDNDSCNIKSTSVNEQSKEDLNVSNDIILFDEIDSSPIDDNLESQSLVIPEDLVNAREPEAVEKDVSKAKDTKEGHSSSNPKPLDQPGIPDDGDDDIFIAMTQKIQADANDDDVTDCEDEPEPPKKVNEQVPDDDLTDCEDDLENVKDKNDVKFEDMCTQVIEEVPLTDKAENTSVDKFKKPMALDDMLTQIIEEDKSDSNCNADLPTQVLEVDPQTNVPFEECLTQQIYSQEIISFKRPSASPFTKKTKTNASPDIIKNLSKIIQNNESKVVDENDEIYYAATQEIFEDLCSQREPITDSKPTTPKIGMNKKLSLKSPTERNKLKRDSQESDEGICLEENGNKNISNLSDSSKVEVVKEEKSVAVRKRISTDSCKSIPREKKETTKKDNRRNIDTINKSKSKKESDRNSLNTTKKDEKSLSDIRLYLNKKSESEAPPSRSSSRIRKPTARLKNSDEDSQKLCNSLFGTIPTSDDIEGNKGKSDEKLQSKEKSKKNNNKSDNSKSKVSKDKIKDDQLPTEKDTKHDDRPRRSRRAKEKTEIAKDETVSINEKKDGGNIRSSRSRSKKSNEDHKRSISSSKETTKTDNKRTQSKETEQNRISPEKEIRRSRRHRTSKKSEEPKDRKSETISSGHEQSTVYNVSSESGIDSPNKLKRSANFEFPSAKKTKVTASLRSNPARKVKTHYVLFTAFPCEEVRIKLEKLGAVIVTDVSKCTVVLTMQIKRTFKLLCAVGLGKPIVGPSWVQACADTNIVVDPWQYLIKDEVTEKRFQFNLERSLLGKRNFLSGYNISSTPNVMPNAEEMKLIVHCSGGNWKDEGPLWICISCSADKSLWPVLKKKGAIIVSTEFILGGVLRQKLEIDKNRLI